MNICQHFLHKLFAVQQTKWKFSIKKKQVPKIQEHFNNKPPDERPYNCKSPPRKQNLTNFPIKIGIKKGSRRDTLNPPMNSCA